MKRTSLILAVFGLALAGSAVAQEQYPSKPIRAIVPYAPGGAVDIVTRIVTEHMRQSLGQPFVIENKPGAFGIIAMEELARARPDGYTLQFGNVNTNAITPVLFAKKMSFNYEKDIVPVARIADVPAFLIATTKDFPPKNFKEFFDYAKQNPGKVRYTSVGVGSFPHFDMEVFGRRAGLELNHIPNKAGAAGSLKDLASGDAHVGFVNLATTGAMVKAGTLRPLAIITEQRQPEYPDVPTMAELGYPNIGTLQWLAVFAPAGTPNEVIEKLHKAVVDAVNSPGVQDAFKKQVIRPLPSKSPADAKQWLQSELAAWRKTADEVKVDLAD